MNMTDPSLFRDHVDPALHCVTVQHSVLSAGQPPMRVWWCVNPVARDELDQVRVQWTVAVVVEFADRDPQPVSFADQRDCIALKVAEFADSHPGAGDSSIARRRWMRASLPRARMNFT